MRINCDGVRSVTLKRVIGTCRAIRPNRAAFPNSNAKFSSYFCCYRLKLCVRRSCTANRPYNGNIVRISNRHLTCWLSSPVECKMLYGESIIFHHRIIRIIVMHRHAMEATIWKSSFVSTLSIRIPIKRIRISLRIRLNFFRCNVSHVRRCFGQGNGST